MDSPRLLLLLLSISVFTFQFCLFYTFHKRAQWSTKAESEAQEKNRLSGLEGLLAVVGLEVTTKGIRTGTGTESWRERVPDFRGCNAKAASAK